MKTDMKMPQQVKMWGKGLPFLRNHGIVMPNREVGGYLPTSFLSIEQIGLNSLLTLG